MAKFNPIIAVPDDGLFTPPVRKWSEEKYRLLGAYCDIFTTSMRNKWDNLVYIDLFAGAGHARIQETGRTVKSSALIALSLPFPFTHYILCEQDSERFTALKARVEREESGKNLILIHGDSNDCVNQVKSALPQYSKENKVLSFCFVDPFSLNLKFRTIKTLSENYNIDFLILLALHMDANRNLKSYLNSSSKKVDEFIENENWRQEFLFKDASGQHFARFLSEKYDENMKELGYYIPELRNKQQIRSNDKNLPLYYLAFYSKHKLGNTFWNKVKTYSSYQTELEF